jgi:glutathione S-transferase
MLLYLDFNAIKKGDGPGGKRFDGPELRSILGDLERELNEGPPGGFFMGKEPGRADIMLEFPMSMIKHRNWVDLKSEFPELDKWLERVYSREAWKRGLEKGNGYDLSVFPRTGRKL